MRAAGPQGHFQTLHSPRIHAKKRNLTPKTNVISANKIRRKCKERSFNGDDQTNRSKECAMTKVTKTLTAIAAAATLAVAAVAVPQPAEARGGGIAAGIIGGLAVGAIIGAAANGGYYGPGYRYGPGPVYYGGAPCYWTHQRVWDGRGGHWRRVRVCD
jgi:hypothetical protein